VIPDLAGQNSGAIVLAQGFARFDVGF